MQQPCYLCADHPPQGKVKQQDKYYCPPCAEAMREAQAIRDEFTAARREGRTQISTIPKERHVRIAPAKVRGTDWI
jgi:hypothetical protein